LPKSPKTADLPAKHSANPGKAGDGILLDLFDNDTAEMQCINAQKTIRARPFGSSCSVLAENTLGRGMSGWLARLALAQGAGFGVERRG
jgi:hypothetical protein